MMKKSNPGASSQADTDNLMLEFFFTLLNPVPLGDGKEQIGTLMRIYPDRIPVTTETLDGIGQWECRLYAGNIFVILNQATNTVLDFISNQETRRYSLDRTIVFGPPDEDGYYEHYFLEPFAEPFLLHDMIMALKAGSEGWVNDEYITVRIDGISLCHRDNITVIEPYRNRQGGQKLL